MFTNQNLPCILVLAIYFGSAFTYKYNKSDISIIAYKPKGLSVSIPYEKSAEGVEFYGRLAPRHDGSKYVAFQLSKFKKYNDRLVAIDGNVVLYNGNMKYALEKNGTRLLKVYTEIVLEDYPISITAYDPQGVRLKLFYSTGVEGFVFWANVNEPLINTKHAVLRLSALEPTEGEWIADNQDISLVVNDIIYPSIHIRRNGQIHKYEYLPPIKIEELKPYLFDIPQLETVTKQTYDSKVPLSTNSQDETTPKAYTRTSQLTTTTESSTSTVEVTTASEEVELSARTATISTDTTTVSSSNPETTTVFSYAFEFYKTSHSTEPYSIPKGPKVEIKVSAGIPKGLILHLSTSEEIEEFKLWANINRPLERMDLADINLSASNKVNGSWTATDDNVSLKMADVLFYAVDVKLGIYSYMYGNKQQTVDDVFLNEALENSTRGASVSSTPMSTKINKSKNRTTVRAKGCQNHVVLNTKDVRITFGSDSNIKKKIREQSKLSYLKIDGCKTSFKVDESDDIPSNLTIIIT